MYDIIIVVYVDRVNGEQHILKYTACKAFFILSMPPAGLPAGSCGGHSGTPGKMSRVIKGVTIIKRNTLFESHPL